MTERGRQTEKCSEGREREDVEKGGDGERMIAAGVFLLPVATYKMESSRTKHTTYTHTFLNHLPIHAIIYSIVPLFRTLSFRPFDFSMI